MNPDIKTHLSHAGWQLFITALYAIALYGILDAFTDFNDNELALVLVYSYLGLNVGWMLGRDWQKKLERKHALQVEAWAHRRVGALIVENADLKREMEVLTAQNKHFERRIVEILDD